MEDTDVFDSVYLGNGADGNLDLFNLAQGSRMQTLGEGFEGRELVHSATTTSMRECGRLGSLGDGAIRVISARLCGAGATPDAINQLLEKASIELYVAERRYFESTMQNVYSEKPEEGRLLKVNIRVAHADTLRVQLRLDSPLRLDAPVRLLINLKMFLSKDPI